MEAHEGTDGQGVGTDASSIAPKVKPPTTAEPEYVVAEITTVAEVADRLEKGEVVANERVYLVVGTKRAESWEAAIRNVATEVEPPPGTRYGAIASRFWGERTTHKNVTVSWELS